MPLNYQVVEARVRHAGAISRRLNEHQRELLIAIGGHERRTLQRFVREAAYARCALIDGEAAAIWGCGGNLVSSSAHVWIALAPAALRFPRLVLAEARAEIEVMLETRRELVTLVCDEYPAAMRYARHLGFEMGAPEMAGNARYRLAILRRRAAAEQPSFTIFALPRSRTAWLSQFLTYGEWRCWHERAIGLRSVADLRSALAETRSGSAETAAGPAWPLIRHFDPRRRFVVVRRPLEDTVRAMIAAGRMAGVEYSEDALRRTMAYGNRCLDQISRLPGTLTVEYSDLATEAACRAIFEFCLPYAFDEAWWRRRRDQNAQIDLAAYFRAYHETRDQVEAFKSATKRELIRLVRAGEL